MIITHLITYLLWTVIPGSIIQVYNALSPSLNEGISITPFLVWKKARFQIALLILAVILVILLNLHSYFNMPVTLTIQLLLFLCQYGLFLFGKLANYFHNNKDDNPKISA